MGFSVSAKTPPEIVSQLARLVNQAMSDPELVAQLTEMGVQPGYLDTARTTDRVAKEIETFTELGKRANISLD